MKINKNLIIILARKGSQRLKNKNLRLLGNKELFLHTIDFAKKFENYFNIMLSTDDPRIMMIAKKKKIICPWLRPSRLSKSYSLSIDVILHGLKWYEKNYISPNIIVLLQPTSPFRYVSSLKNAIKLIKKKKLSSVISISPISLLNKKKFSKNILCNVKNSCIFKGKISDNYKYYFNGNFYIATVKFIKKYRSFFYNNKSLHYILSSKKLSIDIDTIEDFNYAKSFIKI
jgi:CMP-N-acetylneuraminic acid synthetase